MPPFVLRRMTQYVHMREQPRSVSMRNMSLSTVFGVRMGAHAGMSASSHLRDRREHGAVVIGHEDVRDLAPARARRSTRFGVLSMTRSTSMTSSSASPMMMASAKAASGSGFEKVSGPPSRMKGCRSSRSSRKAGMFAASSIATRPAISIS